MKWLKKHYLYITLFIIAFISLSSILYIYTNYKNNQGFVDWNLTPVYRGSGFDKLIYNITIQNTGDTKAEYVKMYIYQENEKGNFDKGEFSGGGSFSFKPMEAATFEYGVPLKNVKTTSDLVKVRKSARLQILWKTDNITKNKVFVIDPNPSS